ncbi:ArsR/SmtB family transcription factor [Ensifer adhaerens]|uniref:ArsR/SmtB family transcription factor n=1 Tax=Ensifer adhaerens TaxID=106592 RepID=UPI003D089033
MTGKMSTMDLERAQLALFAVLAEIARAMGSPHRLMLLQHVSQGARSVERLAELTGLSVANTSQHLQHLKRSNLVTTERDGKRILYGLGTGPIPDVLNSLTRLAEHQQTEIQAVITDSLTQRDRLEGITREQLLERLRDSSVTLLDVRPAEEFAMGHIAGAINIPVETLEEHLSLIPKNQEVVAYCRGPHCVLSTSAVTTLRRNGIKALLLDAGVPEWKAAGFALETGS